MHTYVDLMQGTAWADWFSLGMAGCSVIAFFIGAKALADSISAVKQGVEAEDICITVSGGFSGIMGILAAGFGGILGIVFGIMAYGLAKSLPGLLRKHTSKKSRQPVIVSTLRQMDSLDGISAPVLRDSQDYADAREGRTVQEPEHIPRIKGAALDRPVLDEEEEEDDREKSSEEKRRKNRDIKLT